VSQLLLSIEGGLTWCRTGFGNHGDYVFGWKDDSLQKVLDEECYVQCKTLKTQSIEAMNSCSVPRKVDEDVGDDDCKSIYASLCCKVLMEILGIDAIPGHRMPMA
jgi:hypothetical protein